LIITHHPIFFKSINKLASDSSRETQRAIELIKNNICLYVAHTNLDIAPKGVNYALFNLLELNNDKVEYLSYDKNNLISRIGFLKQETILKEFACFAKKKLLLEKINFYGNANYKIKKVAVCSGSGAGHNYFVAAKEKNCDVYLTGDIKYHAALEAIDLNLNLIDITHWASERIFANVLADELMHYINFEKENDLTIITQKYNNDFINII
jgi:dinuclear metal center YbgI/SA1388 family protein